jgi:outer membrane protein
MVTACNNGAKQQPKSETVKGADQTGSSESIVFVNTDSLLNNYDYFKKVKNQFQEKSKKAQADLSAKGMAFQNEVAAYQKNAASLSTEQRAATEQRLARKQQELSMYNQNASNSLAKDEAAENEKLYDNVSAYLKKHAKDKGYKMVLTYSKSNPVLLFADGSLDVTKEVIKGLNQEYKGK